MECAPSMLAQLSSRNTIDFPNDGRTVVTRTMESTDPRGLRCFLIDRLCWF